jgi:hypothetical protein
MAGISVVDGVEDEFDASGDSQFLKYPEKIFLDGVLAKIQLYGDLAIRQSLGDERDNLFFSRSENAVARGIQYPERRDFGNEFEDVVELFGADPDLAVGDTQEAFAQRTQVGLSDGKDAASS